VGPAALVAAGSMKIRGRERGDSLRYDHSPALVQDVAGRVEGCGRSAAVLPIACSRNTCSAMPAAER
jgi:hypothetical protein